MTTRKFLIGLLSLLILLTMGAVIVHAQSDTTTGNGNDTTTGNGTSITLDNPFKATCGTGTCGLLDLFKAIISNVLLPIGGVLIVCAFIWGGFQFVMANGKPANVTKAKNTILFAAIGAVLILGAYAIQNVIQGTITQLGGPTSSQ